MIEQLNGLPAGVLGFRAHGQVTAADYENVVMPDVEATFALTPRLRVLFQLGEDFTGFDAGAMWDDLNLGLRHFSGWEQVALVTDVGWLRTLAKLFAFALPGEFRLFANAELGDALRWIASPAGRMPAE